MASSMKGKSSRKNLVSFVAVVSLKYINKRVIMFAKICMNSYTWQRVGPLQRAYNVLFFLQQASTPSPKPVFESAKVALNYFMSIRQHEYLYALIDAVYDHPWFYIFFYWQAFTGTVVEHPLQLQTNPQKQVGSSSKVLPFADI